MNNKEAIEYASKRSFLGLYLKGVQDGRAEAILHQCNHDLAVKEAYELGAKERIDAIRTAVKEETQLWMSWTDDMTKQQIAQEALSSAKELMIAILDKIEEETDERQ